MWVFIYTLPFVIFDYRNAKPAIWMWIPSFKFFLGSICIPFCPCFDSFYASSLVVKIFVELNNILCLEKWFLRKKMCNKLVNNCFIIANFIFMFREDYKKESKICISNLDEIFRNTYSRVYFFRYSCMLRVYNFSRNNLLQMLILPTIW